MPHFRAAVSRSAMVAVAAAFFVLPLAAARADAGPFAALAGTWAGSGRMHLDDGRTESLRCRASYTHRDAASLGLSIRCASSSGKVDLRASLHSSGNRVHGEWEEREYNLGGGASGSASGNQIALGIDGGLSGRMSVTTSGSHQSVSIVTHGVALKSIEIGLSRQ